MQQPQQPINNGNGGFGPPKNEPRTPDNGNGGFGPPAPDAFTQGMQSTRSGTSPHMQAEINRRLALRGMPTQTFAEGGAVNPYAQQLTQVSPYVTRDPSLKAADDWNRAFSTANYIPYDVKSSPQQLMEYYQNIAKNRSDAIATSPMPAGFSGTSTGFNLPAGTTLPSTTPAGSNMGVTTVNGQLTFADKAPPAVSSATPQTSGQGLVDNRLASRGLPPQTQPTTTTPQQPVNNGNGGFGPPNPSAPAFGQQPVNNGNGGFGPPNPSAPAFGQQPVNNGNGGFGPPNPSAPAFGQQPDSSAYESKYQQGVTDIALRGAQKQAELLKQQNAMGSIGRGTFGGARQALMQTEGDYNNAQNLAAIQAMGSQAGFQNAQQQFNADRASNIGVQTQNQNVALQQQQLAQQGQQFQAGLGRDIGLAGLNAGIGSSTNLGNLSAAQQQGDLARLQMQGATAAQQQALQQQINDRNMQNYYTAQQYPMQQLDRYGNILRGGQGAMGTVGTTTTPQGSIGAQLMGAGIAGLGLYGQNAQAINKGVDNIVSGVSNWWDNI